MANRMTDISGQKFNRLTAIKPDGRYKSGNVRWLCICDCGNYTHTSTSALKNGESKSCGCYTSERISNRNMKHGDFGTRVYEIWRQMHRRCYGKNAKAYKDYGGRWITICDEWKEYEPFKKWAIAHGYRDDLTIDRIDVNGNYEPSNCRWVTVKQQSNNRRNCHIIEYNGETHTISEWADIYEVDQRKLYYRLSKCGWDVKLAVRCLKGVC